MLIVDCDFCVFFLGVGDVLFYFGEGVVVDEGIVGDVIVEVIVDFEVFDFGSEVFDEIVIDVVLDVDFVCVNVGLI